MNASVQQVMDELAMELQATLELHAQHRMTPRDVHQSLAESMRLAKQAKRLVERTAKAA